MSAPRLRVRIPSPLWSYTADEKTVEAEGDTVDAVLRDLDRRYPGLRFRVVDERGALRRHMKVFVNQDVVRDLSTRLTDDDEVTLMQALSGG